MFSINLFSYHSRGIVNFFRFSKMRVCVPTCYIAVNMFSLIQFLYRPSVQHTCTANKSPKKIPLDVQSKPLNSFKFEIKNYVILLQYIVFYLEYCLHATMKLYIFFQLFLQKLKTWPTATTRRYVALPRVARRCARFRSVATPSSTPGGGGAPSGGCRPFGATA